MIFALPFFSSSRFILPLLLAACMLTSGSARAHQYRGMSTHVTIESTGVLATVRLAHQDILLLAPPADRDRDGSLSREEFQSSRERLVRVAGDSLFVADRNVPALLTTGTVTVTGEGILNGSVDELQFDLTYEPAEATSFTSVLLNPNLFRDIGEVSPITGLPILNAPANTVTILDQGRRVILQATGSETYVTTIGLASASAALPAGSGDNTVSPSGTAHLMRTFLWQGIVHILLGWDHIFFVLGLVLVAPRLRDLLKVITAFTVAHSITLILTALDWIPLRSPSTMSLIEALIAASVAWVGFENLIRLESPLRRRWALVFAFGLIHGFGFANVLRDLLTDHAGGGRGTAVAALLTFNVGVELGQILVLAVVFPILQVLRRYRPVVWRRVAIAGSVFVLFMGASWVVDRTVARETLPWLKPFEE